MNGTGPTLRDIHLPAAPWWPWAPGWWVLLGLVILAVAAVVVIVLRRRSRRTLRAALRELDRLEADCARDPAETQLADRASRLLRRIAVVVEPAAACATGEAWRTFVLRHARSAAVCDALDSLLEARFRAAPALDAAAILPALRAWCRAALHRGTARRGPGVGA